jgi:hypothetical protein
MLGQAVIDFLIAFFSFYFSQKKIKVQTE